MTNVINRT